MHGIPTLPTPAPFSLPMSPFPCPGLLAQGSADTFRGTAAGGGPVRQSSLVEEGGKVPTPHLGVDSTPSGVVYVFHRTEEVRQGGLAYLICVCVCSGGVHVACRA